MKLFGEILLVSEIISLVLAILTTIAVIWAICLYFLQKRDTLEKEKSQEQEEKIAVLVTMHQHFLLCCERTREFVKWLPPRETISGFPLKMAKSLPLPTMAVERTFEIAARCLRDDPEMLRSILKTLEDHSHLNATWNDLEEVISSTPVWLMDPNEAQEISRKFIPVLDVNEELARYSHQATRDCLNQLKERINRIAPERKLEEPEELPPINEINADSSPSDN